MKKLVMVGSSLEPPQSGGLLRTVSIAIRDIAALLGEYVVTPFSDLLHAVTVYRYSIQCRFSLVNLLLDSHIY